METATLAGGPARNAIATLAGGCFWCTQGIFKQIKGIKDVVSGYSGGNMENPSYEKVASGITNHTETIQVTFDPKVISYKDILYIFFKTHDPTTVNRQGHDVGTQYRSVIFYHSDEQKKEAMNVKESLREDFSAPIVTEVLPFEKFYKAEDHHQDYYEKNPEKPYCKLVIDPKIQKLKHDFKKYLK